MRKMERGRELFSSVSVSPCHPYAGDVSFKMLFLRHVTRKVPSPVRSPLVSLLCLLCCALALGERKEKREIDSSVSPRTRALRVERGRATSRRQTARLDRCDDCPHALLCLFLSQKPYRVRVPVVYVPRKVSIACAHTCAFTGCEYNPGRGEVLGSVF